MVRPRSGKVMPMVLVLMVALMLGACGTTPTASPAATAAPAATVAPVNTVAAPATAVPAATAIPPTAVKPTATVAPTATTGPKVGGTLVIAAGSPDTMDPAVAVTEEAVRLMRIVGGTLLIVGPDKKFLPYLAESWKVSDDGLNLVVTLKKGIKFHDGTPLTAQDYVWTCNRVLDPNFKAGSGSIRGTIKSVDLVDDYTFRLNLVRPVFTLLLQMTKWSWMPLSKAFVEKVGTGISKQINGAGPYKLTEFVPDDHILLERNADFSWGPKEIANGGPWYFDKIRIRYGMDAATSLAGLEVGEIDLGRIQPQDLQRITNTDKFNILKTPGAGIYPFLAMNTAKAPYDDLRVRQALNLAVDRDTLVKVVLQGLGIPQYGPVSSVTAGYWPGVEQIGYHFDLPRAKALMKDAGWADSNGDGILEKDGKPFKATLKTIPSPDWFGPVEILQQQFKALGVDVEIQNQDAGILIKDVFAGNYDLSIFGFVSADVEVIGAVVSPTSGMNPARVTDSEVERLLAAVKTTVDPVKRQEFANQLQQRVVEQAYVVPLYAKQTLAALNKRVKGAFTLGSGDSDFGILIGTGYFE